MINGKLAKNKEVSELSIYLFEEQQKAFEEIVKAINKTRRRKLIFVYGEDYIGKSTTAKKLKEVYQDDLELLSIEDNIVEEYHNIGQDQLTKEFLSNNNPEDYLNNLIDNISGKKILVLNKLEYLTTIVISEELLLKKDYNFGKYTKFNYHGVIVWILPIHVFNNYKKHWEIKKSQFLNSIIIKVDPPSENSLRLFYEKYRKTEDLQISSEEIQFCLERKYYRSLKNKKRKQLVN